MNKYILGTAVAVILISGGYLGYQSYQDKDTSSSDTQQQVAASPSPTTPEAKVEHAVNTILNEAVYSMVIPEDSDPALLTSEEESYDTTDQAFNVTQNEL